MNARRIESDPFIGGSPRAYRAARRELRQCAADLHSIPISRVRIAPAAVTLQRSAGDRWISCVTDVVDQHEWYLTRAAPSDTFRLVLHVRA